MNGAPKYRLRPTVRKEVARGNQSQNRFANSCGVTSGHLSQLLSGKRFAGPAVRQRLLDALAPRTFDDLFEEVE